MLRSSLAIGCLLASLLVGGGSARADVIFFNQSGPTYPPPLQAADLAGYQKQLPGLVILRMPGSNTPYLHGVIEGFDGTPYAWKAGSVPGEPTSLVFRPRQGGALAPTTLNIPLNEVWMIEHEVDHPLDLALLFGDRGVPNSPAWQASLRRDLDKSGKLLGTLGSGTSGAAKPNVMGSVVAYLTQPLTKLPTAAGPPADPAADAKRLQDLQAGNPVTPDPLAQTMQKRQAQLEAQHDQTLFGTNHPYRAARMLLQGLARLQAYPNSLGPYLPPPPGKSGPKAGYEALVLAVKDCLRLLCRLITVRPDFDASGDPDLTSRATHFHYAGQAAREAVIELIDGARSGTFLLEYDIPVAVALRQAIMGLQPSEDLSQGDIRALQNRYRAVVTKGLRGPRRFPSDLPLNPTSLALAAVNELREEPSWWVIQPDSDDSYSLIQSLVKLAPLTDSGGHLLPDPRNLDGAGPGGSLTAPSPTRIALSGDVDAAKQFLLPGEAAQVLSLLLYDPTQAGSDPDARRKQKEAGTPAWGPGFLQDVQRATQVFGSHVLQFGGSSSAGEQLLVNTVAVLSGNGRSLTAQLDAVQNLFSIATRTPPPRRAPIGKVDISGGSNDGWSFDPAALGPVSSDNPGNDAQQEQARRFAHARRQKRQEYATRTLLTLANFQQGGKPAPIAEMVLDQLVNVNMRRLDGSAAPGELELLGLVEQLADKGGQKGGPWGGRARRTLDLLPDQVEKRREETQGQRDKAAERLRKARHAGTLSEEQAAQGDLQQAQGRLKALERLAKGQ